MLHILEYHKWGMEKVRGERITIPKYLYHISKSEYRTNILSNGLQPKVGESYSGWAKTKNAVPAVFATINDNPDDIWDGLRIDKDLMLRHGSDLWQINTEKCDNEWFKDAHYDNILDNNPHVVTFTSIPRAALRLFYKSPG